MADPLKTFIIYASADREYRTALERQLKSLIDNDLIQLWSDKEILPGEVWDAAIKKRLLESELFLMLVSADFFNSNYIREEEFSLALEKLGRGEAIVVPIIVRDCDWEAYEVIQKLQVLPPGGVAVTDLRHWHHADIAWATITREIRRLITSQRIAEQQQAEKKKKEAAESARLAEMEKQANAFAEMVFVKGGTFQMGSDDYNSRKPIHSVTLGDFYLGKYPVTQKQWQEIMGSNPPELTFKGCDQCPVERVSWEDIQEFLQKLNAKFPGRNYRLPSEAEWEYAARGGAQSKGFEYAGSNDVAEVAWYKANSGSKTHPVGGKKANELGIYDMSGNVYEWCQDVRHDNYQGAPSNGSAWISGGEQDRRVLRGGSWDYNGNFCRSANRSWSYTTDRSYGFGLRLARHP